MQFVDLKTQYQKIKKDIQSRVETVLEHGQFILGPEVNELERLLAEYCGAKHAIACSSGTDAIILALLAKSIGSGDAVLTSPFTFFATAEAVLRVGATPVFVDIARQSWNLDPDKLESTIKKIEKEGKLKPKAVMPVNLFGLPAEYEKINAVAAKYHLTVIEDAAQSFGAEYKGRRSGTLSDMAATSFFPAKPLGGYGDGGAVFCKSDADAEILKSLRMHGCGAHRYDHIRVGMNGRLDTLQAAILIEKLKIFPQEMQARTGIAALYNDALAKKVRVPIVPFHMKSAWAQYSIECDHRDKLVDHLREAKIPVMIYYPMPLHLQPALKSLGYKLGDFPVAEASAKHILSLPVHPYLKQTEIEAIIKAVLDF